jgi:N-methylhydantoinase A
MLYIGVDIGGTFTDLVVMDESGTVVTDKAPTTPGQLEQGVFDALSLVAADRGETLEALLAQTAAFGHGTTQATNALIERTGARTGLITTQGFGDTVFIQRLLGFTAGVPAERLGWYSRRANPEPIVPRALVREVPERVDQAGHVLLALDEGAVRTAVAELLDTGVEALAVCLLWSFRNPAHERRVAEIIRELVGERDVFVSLSSEVCPVIGEYERTATTVLNSYLGPVVHHYLDRLEQGLRERGFTGTFSVLNSIGGVMGAREATDRAVLLLASGPTGGVIGSRYLADELGHRNVITTDMGGTSFDVGLILDGRPVVVGVTEVAKYHVAAPMVDITAVGSGGGSIASVRDGLISVGPESAGAYPGPVCYGRGGTHPTVTDANVVLGIVDPDRFLGGRMRLDRDAAAAAIEEHIARPLGLDVYQAAAGIRRIVDAQMADTLRELTIGRGHDPRDFVLYAYGGAGPMHCAGYGSELGVAKIVVPTTSMAQSAYGALASDIQHSAERSYLLRGGGGPLAGWVGIDPAVLAQQFAELEARCREELQGYGIAERDVELTRNLDMRYRRQTHELIVPVGAGALDESAVRELVERFERAYEDTYGRGAGFREAGIEITTFRVDAIGRTRKPRLPRAAHRTAAARRERAVYDERGASFVAAEVVDWEGLPLGEHVEGPAVLEHPTTTVFIAAGQHAAIDGHGNLIIEANGGAARPPEVLV